MVLLETKHQKRSLGITTVIFILMFIWFFLYILKDDPNVPEVFEGGEIAINFGTSDVGQGEVQPMEPIKSSPKPTPTEASASAAQNITTQKSTVAPVVKSSETKSTKTGNEAKPKAAESPRPNKTSTDALSSLLNGPKSDGVEGSHGNDGVPGDKGDPNGDKYSNNFYGNGKGGGKSWGLNGRKLSNTGKEVPKCNESGTVVVQVTVNRNGNVVAAKYTQGTTNTNPCLVEPAIATAKKYKWQPDSDAPETQIGFIVVHFKLGE